MKAKFLAAATCVVAFAAFANAQTASKVAVVDTEAFTDMTNGVKKLVAGFQQVQAEFKTKIDEVNQLKARYDALAKEINDTRGTAAPASLQAKADQAETLKTDFERRSADYQRALDKRVQEVTDPIYSDLSKALDAYAKAKGYDMLIDINKLNGAVMLINPTIDITTAFIADYNAKNPLGATPKPQ